MHRDSWITALRFSLAGWRGPALVLIPVAIVLSVTAMHPILTFTCAALALVPLASLLGDSTEQLGAHVGATAGGLLNATAGNLPELVFGMIALADGHAAVVRATVVGSIIGNLLLVFGLAAFAGSLGREKLRFSPAAADANTKMLTLAALALGTPSLFHHLHWGGSAASDARLGQLNIWAAAVLLVVYAASLIFMLHTHHSLFRGQSIVTPVIGRSAALAILILAAGLVAVISQVLVGGLESITRSTGWTELFIGVVIVAVLGNAAEHASAIVLARRGQMDLSLQIAVGSGAQVALFIAPLLVVVSRLWLPHCMVFHPLEIGAILVSVGVVTVATIDGETNWFEGLQLIGAYVILAAFFYFLPPLTN